MAQVVRWDVRNWSSIAVIILICALCILPLVALLAELENIPIIKSLYNVEHLSIFARSVALCATATALSMFLGCLLAFLLVGTNLPGRIAFFILFSIPLVLPSYIHGIAWSYLLGTNTGLNALYRELAGSNNTLITVSGWFSAVWVFTVTYYPITMFTIGAAILRWDRRYDEAALLHAKPLKVFILIKTGYFLGPLLVSGLLIFLLTFSDFSVPDLFQIQVYAVEIFILMSGYLDIGAAVAASILPMILGVMLLLMILRLSGQLDLSSPDGRARRVEIYKLGTWRLPLLIVIAILAVIVVVLPLAQLLYTAESMDTFKRAWVMAIDDALHSAFTAVLATLSGITLAFFAAYFYVRRITPAGAWLRLLLLLYLTLPASFTGLGLILLWNRDGWMGWVYDSILMVVLGLIVRWLPLLFEIISILLRQIPKSIEEAAHTIGCSWGATIRTILLPRMLPVLGVTFALGFVFCFNELTITLLLSPPGVSSISVRFFSLVHYGPEKLVAALCLLHIAFIALPVGILVWFGERYFRIGMRSQTLSKSVSLLC